MSVVYRLSKLKQTKTNLGRANADRAHRKMDDILGCIVIATAGRDKNRTFIVIKKLDDLYVLIADGKCRRLEKPKKKKIKHLKKVLDADYDILTPLNVGAGLTNRTLREKVGAYEAHMRDRGV